MFGELWRATQGLRQLIVFMVIMCAGMAADSMTMPQLIIAGLIVVGFSITMIFD